jgi:crotonobetainyl-CoA:carnitine CoA-transferase CaiB-like acyl-CoA transferase
VALLDSVGVPAAEVREPSQAVRDERVVRRGETVPLRHPEYTQTDEVYGTGLPIRFSGAEAGFTRPAPWVGQHNDEVYGELLGYSPETLAQLRADGVI